MRDKPTRCFTSGCPLAVFCGCSHHLDKHPDLGHCTVVTDNRLCECMAFRSKGKGFVLGTGNPETAKFAIILEAPGQEELGFPIEGPGAPGIIPTDELARRKRDYPDVEERFLSRGAAIVGRSGSLVNKWALPKTGTLRTEIFVDNTLRCLSPKNKKGEWYPTGAERNQAESCCRQWDRVQKFGPQVLEVTVHPASLLREVNPLPLFNKDVEKAASFARQGYKTVLLMGGKAAEAFMGHAANVTRWRGHYEVLKNRGEGWYDSVVARLRTKASKGKNADDMCRCEHVRHNHNPGCSECTECQKFRKKPVKKVSKAQKLSGVPVEPDVLDTPSTELPKIKRVRKKKVKDEQR